MKKKSNKKGEDIFCYDMGERGARGHETQGRRKVVGNQLSFSAAEAYKLLRTNLIFSMSDERECKIIGVTSALRGEGKSVTSVNLAYTLAETKKRVLLIDADMRIPVVAKILEIPEAPGLSNVLAGVSQLNDAVQVSPLLKSLFVLPAGEIPPNPSELLSSVRMQQMLGVLSESFDYIIVDIPPVNAVSDSLAVSKLLSGMIMVVRQNYCNRHSLAEAMRQLEFLKVKVLGFVMNDTGSAKTKYKKYGHRNRYNQGYGYGYRQPGTDQAGDSKAETSETVGV
ncbi:MAG: CpsD/CapB family tyrosine-protein kinase [Oscillospiraceae bacterium]|jgi:capsular exopolysaccharide synthesis family protein